MRPEKNAGTILEIRLGLREAGFSPLPVNGKRPVQDRWQTGLGSSHGEIQSWDRNFPHAKNTGILTATVPALDIDIFNEEAAEAVELLVRERFGDDGTILVRFGQPPKRLIPFLTDRPFPKIQYNLIAANGTEGEKLELLADGQQFVAFGIHPETGKSYSWFGGEPGKTARGDLPHIDEARARKLIEDAVAIVCRDYGYKPTASRPRKTKGKGAGGGPADWGHLAANIQAGRNLHDSLLALAGKLVKSGMGTGAAINHLRGLLDTSTAARDDRWKERWDDVPRLVESAEKPEEKTEQKQPAEQRKLAEVHKIFQKWLGQDYDLATLDAVLAVAAAERLPGDPPWLLIISGSGNAKTETVQATSGLGAQVVSTITSDAALLSASPRKQRSKDATGGLLRQIGDRGILVIKDFTSILSASREMRGTILAALREVHDGQWVRNVGTDGGLSLVWKGRVIVIGACTTAWDQAHSVIATMGDRFVLVRSDSSIGRVSSGLRAMKNTGSETVMRQEMADAVAGLVCSVDANNVYQLTKEDEAAILNAADLVTRARTGVELDYRGDVIDAHAPEMPTRFAKQLTQIMRGGVAIGMSPIDALWLAIRCARDSMPQLRLAVLRDVAANANCRVIDVRRRLQKPRATVDRALQALHTLGLLVCEEEQEERAGKTVFVRRYRLADGISLEALALADPEREGGSGRLI